MWWVTPEVPSPGTPGASPEQGPCFQVCGHLHRAQELAEEGRAGAHLGRKITGAFSKQSPFRWLTEPGAVLLLNKMQGSLPKPTLRCANSPPEAVPRALQLPRGGGGGGGGVNVNTTPRGSQVDLLCFALLCGQEMHDFQRCQKRMQRRDPNSSKERHEGQVHQGSRVPSHLGSEAAAAALSAELPLGKLQAQESPRSVDPVAASQPRGSGLGGIPSSR